jgi:hypothetical protein
VVGRVGSWRGWLPFLAPPRSQLSSPLSQAGEAEADAGLACPAFFIPPGHVWVLADNAALDPAKGEVGDRLN